LSACNTELGWLNLLYRRFALKFKIKLNDLGLILPTYSHEAFECADHERVKKTDDLTVFFTLLGSALPKLLVKH